MWLAPTLKKEAEVLVLGKAVTLPISDMADGCVGCMLVFDTRESAVKYIGDEEGTIIQIKLKGDKP